MPLLTELVQVRDCTTLRLGGLAEIFIRADTEAEVVAAVQAADQASLPLLVLGGGSNLVVADDGFPGVVVQVASTGVRVAAAESGQLVVDVAAGEAWDRLADWAVAEQLAGIECLAGIPGRAGATPIQNVGAYGQEVAGVIESVRVFDRSTANVVTLTSDECCFDYRDSMFKRAAQQAADPTGRYVVLEVRLRLERSALSAPVRYAELASKLGITIGERAPIGQVRAAVLELRRGKGMVLDPADPDTRSAGSFFTNPVLSADQFAALADRIAARSGPVPVPRYPAGPGQVKVSAAWLIEHAGFEKGYPGRGAIRISTKHTLALTNRGGGTTGELVAVARQIVAGVRESFGVELVSEPVLVGVRL